MKKTIPPLPIKPHHIPFIILVLAAISLSIGLALTFLDKQVPAASGNIYIEKATAGAYKDQPITYTIRIFPGTSLDTVTSTITYDDDLTYKSVSYIDSPFNVQIPAITSQTGAVTIQSAKFNGTIDSDALIARVTFMARRSGNHTVQLSAGNAAHAGIATNPTLSGGTNPAADPGLIAQTNCVSTNCSHATKAVDPPSLTSSSVMMSPLEVTQSLLKTVGVSSLKAKYAAPWLLGVIGCLILLGIAVITHVVIKRRRLQKNQLSKESLQETKQ